MDGAKEGGDVSATNEAMGGYDSNRGPGLDRLFPVQLPGGRTATVTHVSIAPTNEGIFEGGLRRDANAIQEERWIEWARKRHGDPLHVVEPLVTPVPSQGPRRERLPWMACAATLRSAPLDPEMTDSHLTLVWWQDPSDEPIRTWVERAAAGLDWNAAAKDWLYW